VLPLFLSTIEDDSDRAYMAGLYEQYFPLVKKKTYDLIGEYSVTGDLVQDVFIKLIPKVSLLRSLDSCKRTPYIVYTVRSVCMDYIRKKARGSAKLQAAGAVDLEEIEDPQALPEEQTIKRESYEALGKALEHISERDRQLLIYKYLMGLKDKEIASALNIPNRNIQAYLSRARRRAQTVLSKERGRQDGQE
jgi:RNA polymerase sigma-70 factor (ECF subfamily)